MSEHGPSQPPFSGETQGKPEAEIEAQDLQAAQQDPKVKDFLEEARREGKKMDEEGLIHP